MTHVWFIQGFPMAVTNEETVRYWEARGKAIIQVPIPEGFFQDRKPTQDFRWSR
jgi:hypothetical protein